VKGEDIQKMSYDLLSKTSTSFKYYFAMQKTLSNGKSQKCHLDANEGLLVSSISKLITYFIDGITLRMKYKSSAYY
jgi:hypothetical protein